VLASLAHAADPGAAPTTSVGNTIGQLDENATRAHRFAIGADVVFGVAGAAAVSSVVMLLVDVKRPIAPRVPDVALLPHGVSMSWAF
jgi:hypothetical protein